MTVPENPFTTIPVTKLNQSGIKSSLVSIMNCNFYKSTYEIKNQDKLILILIIIATSRYIANVNNTLEMYIIIVSYSIYLFEHIVIRLEQFS
jgi:hypothetical protein